MAIYCSRCSVKCKGNLKIEARKGSYYPFCPFCFNILRFKDMKEIRQVIKLNKRAKVI